MEEIDIIKKEVEELKKKNIELEERLKKYTNGDNHKRYYKKNKEKVMELGANISRSFSPPRFKSKPIASILGIPVIPREDIIYHNWKRYRLGI